MKSKTFFIILLFLLITLIVTFLFIFNSFYSDIFQLCGTRSTMEKVVDLAIKQNDPTICSKIKYGIPFWGCGPGSTREEKVNICYARTAVALEDYNICEYVTGYNNGCYTSIAIKVKDSSICEKIPIKYVDMDQRDTNIRNSFVEQCKKWVSQQSNKSIT